MGQIILYLCAGICMLVYVPAAVLAVQEIFTRKATFSINAFRIHFTGAGAMLFGLGQLASSAMAIVGILLAIQNSNIFYIFGGTIFGAIAALIGLWAARKTQAGEVEFVSPINMEIRIDEENGFVFRQGMDKEQFNPDDVIVIEDEDGNTEPKSAQAATDDDIIEGEYTEIDPDDDNDKRRD